MTSIVETFVTDDELFAQPYIDLQEERADPQPHHYVHGGFTGTDTRFSFYLPPEELYQGRFHQHITPVPESEHLAPGHLGAEDKIGFAFSCGGFFVETNGGGEVDLSRPRAGVDATIGAYRANAAAAAFAKVVAQRLYGPHRVYGYAYGGSGGGFRTIACAEHTEGVWDGFVPYVIGSPMAIPNVFTVRMHATRVLRDVLDDIADAVQPGADRDMYDGLDAEQRAALAEVTGMGFPPPAWYGHRTMGTQAFGMLFGALLALDPGYFEDFWTVPGYLGADPDSSVHRDRVRLTTTVAQVYTRHEAAEAQLLPDDANGPAGGVDEAFKGPNSGGEVVVALRLADAVPLDPRNAQLTVRSGAAEGVAANLQRVTGNLAVIDFPDLWPQLRGLCPGDRVEIDNSAFLAAQTYHRHQVPDPEFAVWDQFREPDGSPTYPQRPQLLGPLMSRGATGTAQTGRISGRMIVVEAGRDREAYPWQADWYRTKVREYLGEQAEDRFRVWMVDNALHADVSWQEHPTHTVPYLGVLQCALRAVAAWCETGQEPPASTDYRIHDGQVVLPHAAEQRLGVQQTVALTADGGARAEIGTHEEVVLRVASEVPPGVSRIVEVAWDLDGSGAFAVRETVPPAEHVVREHRHTFTAPGTHFVAVRVTAQPDGDGATPFARIYALGRARIVVS